MKDFWISKSRLRGVLVICCLYLLNLSFCWSLNDEGVALLRFKEKVASDPHGALSNWSDENGVESPCFWFGVECSQGYVVALNLKDLCLRGTLSPSIGDPIHLKSIILRNNSFFGIIPVEIANLKVLELLDIGYNNFSGQLPSQLGNHFTKSVLLVDNNELLESRYLETNELQKPSQVRAKDLLSSITRTQEEKGDHVARRKLLQEPTEFKFFPRSLLSLEATEGYSPPPISSRSPRRRRRLLRLQLRQPDPPRETGSDAYPRPLASPPSPSPVTTLASPAEAPSAPTKHSGNSHRLLIVSAATGGPLLLLVIIGIFFWKTGKVATVNPWATGLSGQLQRAFVTGVPKLKRSELEAACEDFSNVIGSSSLCTLYKGTLSSGVEIAVASIGVASVKNWSNSLEANFRNKIETLSKVSHKNFVSLIGYSVEEEPFTRMMVFEYAPNGTLFEHLHIREAEHLDWAMRMRIAMGVAYCLEHMHHQLTPPLAHRNFTSSAVYLTEDYAAKVSDFGFSDEGSTSEPNAQSNVYSFGVVLFEMITGKLPYLAGSGPLDDWASDYLSGAQNLREMVDPTLETYNEDQLQEIGGVIRLCVNPEPRLRPSMREVCAWLRQTTGIEPDGAIPRLSPLWWAELEILATEAS